MVERQTLNLIVGVRVPVPDPIHEEIMNKVRVSLREIMEDDNHPLMQKWVDELIPLLAPIVKKQNPKLHDELIRVSLTGKTPDSDSGIRSSNL